MTIKEKLQNVPQQPGSYQMKDSSGNIIYVGKAKNLKNRITSYFTGSHDYKTTKLISLIDTFEYIVTSSELDALILEIDLIKKYQPRYNILLTDDKSYPYIEITQEKHPKLVVTRTVNKKKRQLFGPYPNVSAARETLKLLNKLYPLRKCQKLPKEPCLYYYLGQCLAPCINKVEKSTYQAIKKDITDFLKGHTKDVIADLTKKMHKASEALEFERAQEYRDTINAIHTTTKRQEVNLNDLKDRDIIAIDHDEYHVAIEIFFVRNGKINARDQKLIPYYIDVESSVLDYIIQFYQTYPLPKEIFVSDPMYISYLEPLFEIKVMTPQRGPKKKLLDVARLNAKETLRHQAKILEREQEKTFGAIDELGETLGISTPYHIEAFDNSHTFGTYPVSSLVVFKNGKPSKKDYRKYKLDTSQKQSGDTDQMKEVFYRRYRRLLLEDQKHPDLILVDGGIQQMNAAKAILNSLDLDIPLVGMVKSENHKTHHLLDTDTNTIELKVGTKLFNLLSYIQEEAHRFAITFHKDLRHKGIFKSVLDDIEGVGDITKTKLLKTFKTIENIKQANDEALKALGINQKTIRNIKEALNNK